MSSPRHLLSLGCLLAALPFAVNAAETPKVGIAGAVNPATNSTQPGSETRLLTIGADMVFKEEIVTDANGQAQIVFLDRSGLTVGPNARLTIDEFVYDPNTKTGKLAVNAVVGAFRFVGGRLSKDGNVTINTPVATIGIRGGIVLANVLPDRVDVTMLFGNAITVHNRMTGAVQHITRPGFTASISRLQPGGGPVRAKPDQVAAQLGNFEATQGNPLNDTLQIDTLTVDTALNQPTGTPAGGVSLPTGNTGTTGTTGGGIAPSTILLDSSGPTTLTNLSPSLTTGSPLDLSRVQTQERLITNMTNTATATQTILNVIEAARTVAPTAAPAAPAAGTRLPPPPSM